MQFAELSLEQRRRLVDVSQAFEAWRAANIELRHSYRGGIKWKTVDGRDYLYIANRSRGRRDERTETIAKQFKDHRAVVKRRLATLGRRLNDMARVNRAMGLGRVPEMAARILRKLDAEGLLGKHLFVVGTHAMFAYEAAAGVLFESNLTETQDIDLMWDARQRLRIALVDARADGVLGLLKKVDHSFAKQNTYRAINDEGYYVDLIRPIEKDEMRRLISTIGPAEDDLVAAALEGLGWLINAPKFNQIAVGADGMPLYISCVDPRVFALHKHWLSKIRQDAIKRPRDEAQARAVAAVAKRYLNLPFTKRDLTAVPVDVAKESRALLAAN